MNKKETKKDRKTERTKEKEIATLFCTQCTILPRTRALLRCGRSHYRDQCPVLTRHAAKKKKKKKKKRKKEKKKKKNKRRECNTGNPMRGMVVT
jgi:hypothetical protein